MYIRCGEFECKPFDRVGTLRTSLEVKAARPTGKISDVFDFLKREGGPSLSIEGMNEIAARGWAGRRRGGRR